MFQAFQDFLLNREKATIICALIFFVDTIYTLAHYYRTKFNPNYKSSSVFIGAAMIFSVLVVSNTILLPAESWLGFLVFKLLDFAVFFLLYAILYLGIPVLFKIKD